MTGILFTNGHLLSGGASISPAKASAIYVENGRIQAIGTVSDLTLQLARKEYKKVDLHGAFILPGLVDSHMHLSMHGMKLTMLDFTGVKSKEEMLHMVRKRVEETPPGEWVMGLNWNENEFTQSSVPTKDELDEISTDHPIYLTRTCYHAHIANTAAFERAGVTESTPDPADGSYGRDASGRLNGWIYENAAKPFIGSQPKPKYQDKKDYVRRACQHALSLGLTAAHSEDLRYLGDISTMLRIHRELLEEGVFFRSHHLIYHTHLDELESLGLTAGSGDEWLKIGAVKIFSDGAIGGRTALLSEPYHDAPHTKGMAIHSQEELNEITRKARQLGMPIAVHAIGDGGAEMTITAMETHPVHGITRFRDRLIHAQVFRKDLVERMRALQAALDIQPRFVASDFPWVIERVGEERLEYLYAWKKLLNAGLICAGGSDAPIEPLNPLLGLHAAVTRRKPGETHEGYLPDEKLSLQEAVHLFTLGSAQAASEEDERGTLSVGKWADFTIVDQDIYAVDPDDIIQTKVVMTVVNGKIAYKA